MIMITVMKRMITKCHYFDMVNRVYLIGFMGSGKSTMGRWLADALQWTFLDLDHYIENKYHKTISKIFEESGEDGFREIEAKCLREVGDFDKVIIGAGGGTPCFYDNMDVMNATGLTIYLKLEPNVLNDRLCASKSQRPLVANKNGDELLKFISDKLDEREPYYTKAKIIADGTVWSVEDFVNVVVNSK